MSLLRITALGLLTAVSFAPSARAAEAASQPSAAAPAPSVTPTAAPSLENVGDEAERVNLDAIKQKYWARGNEDELGVVQNRMYTKEHKIELGAYGGFVTTDPFLTVTSFGLSLSYHYNEYLSFGAFAMKDWYSPSSALVFLRNPYPNGAGSNTSTNPPYWYLGGEAMASILYGKLSLIGKAIIHYDFHFIAGLGSTSTFSGSYITPVVGVGQQFFVTRALTLRFDYRLMIYDETILQQVGSPSSPNGTPLGNRVNYTNAVTLGVSYLFDLFGKKPPAEDTSGQAAGAPQAK